MTSRRESYLPPGCSHPAAGGRFPRHEGEYGCGTWHRVVVTLNRRGGVRRGNVRGNGPAPVLDRALRRYATAPAVLPDRALRFYAIAPAASRSNSASSSGSTTCCSGCASYQPTISRAPSAKPIVGLKAGTSDLTRLLSKIIE